MAIVLKIEQKKSQNLNKIYLVLQVLREGKDIFANLPVFGRLTYLTCP